MINDSVALVGCCLAGGWREVGILSRGKRTQDLSKGLKASKIQAKWNLKYLMARCYLPLVRWDYEVVPEYSSHSLTTVYRTWWTFDGDR